MDEVGVDALMNREGRMLIIRDCVFLNVEGRTGTFNAESESDACVSFAGCCCGNGGGGTDNKLLLVPWLTSVFISPGEDARRRNGFCLGIV